MEVRTKKHRKRSKEIVSPYDIQQIERLKSIVADFHTQGKRKRYSVLVDGETVVPINTDARKFDNYKRYLLNSTGRVEVRMYFNDSNNCNKYVFQMGNNGINGIEQKEVEQQVLEALEKERIQNKVKALTQELEEQNEMIVSYKKKIEKLKKNQFTMDKMIQSGMQIYSQLNGNTISKPVNQIGEIPEPVASVEIESEKASKVDKYFAEMKERLGKKRLKEGIRIWEIISEYPELEEEFDNIINQKIQEDEKA